VYNATNTCKLVENLACHLVSGGILLTGASEFETAFLVCVGLVVRTHTVACRVIQEREGRRAVDPALQYQRLSTKVPSNEGKCISGVNAVRVCDATAVDVSHERVHA